MSSFIKRQEEILKSIIKNCGYEVETVDLVVSSRRDLGEYQYNGVMALAKSLKKNPREIADEIVSELKKEDSFININVAGPGFINLSFSNDSLIKYMNELLSDIDAGIDKLDKRKVVIDYGGPNVAKALHVGHLRSANIGEAIKRLAKTLGYDVISDVHLGDWGRPMGLVVLELSKLHPEWLYFDEKYEGEYPDDYLITNEDLERLYPIASSKAKEDETYLEEARIITTKLQQKQRGIYDLWKKIIEVSVNEIRKMYDKLNVSFDLWNGESDADEYVGRVLEFLKNKELVYESQGALVIDVNKEDDKVNVPPLLLIRSNGAVSYETTDLATIWERRDNFSPDEIWYVVDNRQALHFEQVFRAAYKSGIISKNIKLEFLGFGTMNGKDGKPFKTRDGGVMTLSSLYEEIKQEALRQMKENVLDEEKDKVADAITVSILKYADLLSVRSTDYVFDVQKFSDMNGKTGVYLLYSTIRIKSLLDKARELNLSMNNIYSINNEYDKEVYLKLLQMSNVLKKSLESRSLHEITDYLYNLTNVYNNFYSNNRILTETNNEIRESWLCLSMLVYMTNKKLLDILGISLPDKI